MSIVYLGISLKNQQEHPLADEIKFCSNQELRSLKISHDEYPYFLDAIKSLGFIEELALISTCNRFEIIMFLKENTMTSANIEKIQLTVKSITKSNIDLGLLDNQKAEYQFLRTFCGLNSGLIGESEISQQIEISFRQAIIMGYMSKKGLELLEKAIKLKSIISNLVLKEKISYCQIALKSALKTLNHQVFSKVIVLGSGSTSLESCRALVDFGVAPQNIHLIHRISSSSGQISRFKSTLELNHMNYLRAKYGYHMDKVKAFVADSDLLIFGIDSRNSIMSFSQNSKISIIDFNSKPSCSFEFDQAPNNYISSDMLDSYVRNYTEKRLLDKSFCNSIKMIDEIVCNALDIRLVTKSPNLRLASSEKFELTTHK